MNESFNLCMDALIMRAGVEVPAGKPISCSPGEGMYLHVSQVRIATLVMFSL